MSSCTLPQLNPQPATLPAGMERSPGRGSWAETFAASGANPTQDRDRSFREGLTLKLLGFASFLGPLPGLMKMSVDDLRRCVRSGALSSS